MEGISDKLWAIGAALISALGGYVLYEKKAVDARIDKIENDLAQHKIDVAVIQEGIKNLKEDTQEIKELLSRRKK